MQARGGNAQDFLLREQKRLERPTCASDQRKYDALSAEILRRRISNTDDAEDDSIMR